MREGNGEKRPHQTIQERFEEFNAAHPEIFAYLVALSFELYFKGRARYGIKSLYERARWHFVVEKDADEDFKLPNNYHSRYALLIMQKHPELEGLFELCALRTQ
jgi:hypothetical protein